MEAIRGGRKSQDGIYWDFSDYLFSTTWPGSFFGSFRLVFYAL